MPPFGLITPTAVPASSLSYGWASTVFRYVTLYELHHVVGENRQPSDNSANLIAWKTMLIADPLHREFRAPPTWQVRPEISQTRGATELQPC